MHESRTDQEATVGPTLTLDTRHAYRGFDVERGVCRVRIFETEGQPPVAVLTELPENPATSITNLIEHLAPEIVKTSLPHRVHETPPTIFVEHSGVEGDSELLSGRWRRSGPHVARVTFTTMRPRIVRLGNVDRLSYGEPTWSHLDQTALVALLGDGVTLDADTP
jgi:hypothetical protein